MTKSCWFAVVVLMLACAMCITGCSKWRSAKKPGDTGIGPIGPEGEITGIGLPPHGGVGTILSNVKFDTVLFDYDSAQINEAERGKIEAVADYLKKNSQVGAIVEGHCDERGSAEYNMALGERRALAVRAYLVGLKIDGDLIQTKSYGKERPLNPGHDESAWRVNRRAEFVFFSK